MLQIWIALTGCVLCSLSGVAWAGNNTITDEIFLEIRIDPINRKKEPVRGRIVIGVFGDALPMTSWNFLSLARGFTHVNSQVRFHYKETIVNRIVPDFLIQMGDNVMSHGPGSRSVYAPFFIDENYYHSHRSAGYVAMANQGQDTNGSQFYITLSKARWLDGKNVVFGKVVQGIDFVHKIAEAETNDNNFPIQKVTITDCGVLPLKKPYDLTDAQMTSEKDVKQ